ncbi:MAG: methyltransferase domain-containing protein [Steroidobacteraceae bacterium]
MYERTGRYYALFGPTAVTTPAEDAFFRHWSADRRRALDLGAGLCGPATLLASFGLEVLAIEPSAVLATLALDRLSRGEEAAQKVTLVEGDVSALNEDYRADIIVLRSVWMLIDDEARATALAAMRKHAAPGAILIVDARTVALDWADHPGPQEEKHIGHTLYRRRTRYSRRENGDTEVYWSIEVERFGRHIEFVDETFVVRADTAHGIAADLMRAGWRIERIFRGYDLDAPYVEGAPMIVIVARDEPQKEEA